jgi:hypothetical protein
MLAEKPQFRELRAENVENDGDFPEFTATAPGIDVAKQAQERRRELASLREAGVASREISAKSPTPPESQEGMGKRRRTRRKKRATRRS